MTLQNVWRESIPYDAACTDTDMEVEILDEQSLSNRNVIRFPKFIAFFGPDGAGKSTQAELLVGFLQSKGFRVKKAWVRSTHTVAYLLWSMFYRLGLCRDCSGLPMKVSGKFAVSYLSEAAYGAVSPITMSPPILNGRFSRFVWSVVELVGVVPVILLQVYIPLFLGRTVVAERYVVDSIASIAYFLGDVNFVDGWQARFLLSFVPKGTRFFYVNADYNTVFERRGAFAGPAEYTDFHRRIFDRLAGRVGAVCLDASKRSIEELHNQLLDCVSGHACAQINRV